MVNSITNKINESLDENNPLDLLSSKSQVTPFTKNKDKIIIIEQILLIMPLQLCVT